MYDILDIEELYEELRHAVLSLYLKTSRDVEAHVLHKTRLDYEVKYGNK